MKMDWFSPSSKRAAYLATGQTMFAGGSGSSKKRSKAVVGDEDDDEEGWDDGEEDDDEGGAEGVEGAEGNEDDEEEEGEEEESQGQRKKLLASIRKNVAAEMRAQAVSKSNQKQIRTVVDSALKGLDLDGLRNFNKIEKTVRSLSSAFDKLKNQQNAGQKRDALKELIERNMDEIEKLMKSKNKRSITLNSRAAVIMDTTNVVTGTLPDDILESFSIDSFIPKRRPRQFVRDIADVTRVDEVTEYKVWYEEGSEEGAIALVAEGGLKPMVSFDLVRNTHEVRKAAGKVVFTEEVSKFRKQAYSIIRKLFNDKVWRDYNNIVSADLVAAAVPYSGTTLDGKFANPTDFHAIGAVAAQIESLEFIPDVLVINPQDKWRIALSQSSDGQFYMAIPTMQVDGSISMFGFRVITTNKVAPGEFLLGESGLYKIEEEAVQIRMGYGLSMNGATPEFDLDHNRFRIIGEVFFHNYISSAYAGSFVKGNFATIKTALKTP